MTTQTPLQEARERARQAQEAKKAELKRRKDAFREALAAEMRERGHEVEDDCHKVDGVYTGIMVKEQQSGGAWHRHGNGRLHVSFSVGYGRNKMTYSAPEGKKGFNVKKAADNLEQQVQFRKTEQEQMQQRQDRRATNEAICKRIREELGLPQYGQPNVIVDAQGRLALDVGNVTEAEAEALLRTLLVIRTPLSR
jgi:hypothetical protein